MRGPFYILTLSPPLLFLPPPLSFSAGLDSAIETLIVAEDDQEFFAHHKEALDKLDASSGALSPPPLLLFCVLLFFPSLSLQAFSLPLSLSPFSSVSFCVSMSSLHIPSLFIDKKKTGLADSLKKLGAPQVSATGATVR